MDLKRPDPGRPPQWLRYFNTNRSQNNRIKSVVCNIEECFDEFDSLSDAGNDLSPLSPLYLSSAQKPEEAEDAVKLILETSESPCFQEPSFVRTLNPIDSEPQENRGGGDEERDHRASPLLLNDDRFTSEEALQPKQKMESLGAAVNMTNNGKRSKATVDLKVPAKPLAEGPECVVPSDSKSLNFKDTSAFLLKLKDANRPKTRAQTLPVAMPAHLEPIEDFLILDDEDLRSPCHISIPKRLNTNKNKPTQGGEHPRATVKDAEVTGKARQIEGEEKPKKSKGKQDQCNKEDNVHAHHIKSKGKTSRVTNLQLKWQEGRKKEKSLKTQQNRDVSDRQEDTPPSLSSPFSEIRDEGGSQDICRDQEAPPVATEHKITAEKRKRRKRQDANDAAKDLGTQQPGPSKKTNSAKVQNSVELRSAPSAEEGLGAVEKSSVSQKEKAAAGRKRNAKQHGLSVRTNVKLVKAPLQEQQSHEEWQDETLQPHVKNVCVSPCSPEDDHYCPALAKKNHRDLVEKSGGCTDLKLKKDRCLNQTEYYRSEDVGKRKRRKPGTWWLVNQDELQDDNEDSSIMVNKKKLQLSKGKRLNSVQELPEPAVHKQRKTELNSGTNRNLSQRKKQLLNSPKLKGPSKVPNILKQQEEKGDDRGRGHRDINIKSKPVKCLNSTSEVDVTGSFNNVHNAATPRKSYCSEGLRVPQRSTDGDGSQSSQRLFHGSRWEVQKVQVFNGDASTQDLEGNVQKGCVTKRQKKQSSQEPWASSRNPLPRSLLAKNTKAAMAHFDAVLTPDDAKETAVPKSAQCLQGETHPAPRCRKDTLDDHQRSCSPSFQTESHEDNLPSVTGTNPVHVTHTHSHSAVRYQRCMTMMPPAPSSHRAHRSGRRSSDVEILNGFKSGPSSMIDLGIYEDDKDMSLSYDEGNISQNTICQPPLSPIVLQVEDRADLVMWLKSVLSTSDGTSVITPEHFQWYGYCGRAMGIRLDLLSDNFCCGKVLLGSYMKKPLQVDTRAVSVYNVLTSSLRVKINSAETILSPGETFMVPCGHEYEMHNLTAEPALLFYNRMLSEIV